MPYRNALRDNFRRFMDVNDREMRQYAQQYAQQYQPQGQYAAAEAGAATLYPEMADDMSNVVFNEDGSYYIMGGPDDPNMQGQGGGGYETQQDQNYNPESGIDAITRRRQAIADALME